MYFPILKKIRKIIQNIEILGCPNLQVFLEETLGPLEMNDWHI